MVSGLDKAFCMADLESLTLKERERLIPVLKAKDLDAYNYLRWSMYIFMPEDIAEAEFCTDYPHFHARLLAFQQQLNERYQYNRQIPYWSFVFPRNQKLFERKEEKIFVPCKERISNKSFFRFCLAPEGFYPLQDVTCLVRKKTCRESIEYLLAYLNNRRIFNWLQFNGIVKGAIVEFSESPIASIPYRPIKWDDKEEVRLHDEITSHTRRYLEDKDRSHLTVIENNFTHLFHEESNT
jgi:adenine-specific DNA-methyltransferase